MAQKEFPKSVEDVVTTLADIFRHQGQLDVVGLLESASARIEETNYDNWNGGIERELGVINKAQMCKDENRQRSELLRLHAWQLVAQRSNSAVQRKQSAAQRHRDYRRTKGQVQLFHP